MSGDWISSLGITTPMILLFLALLLLGFVAVGLSVSVAVIVARRRADSELKAGKSQAKIDLSIAILAISALLPILAGALSRYGAYYGAAIILAAIGPLLLWPVSAVLAIRGRGAGRRVLLVGHGLIAVMVALLILIPLIVCISRR
jgi:hypothetical protein